MESDTPSADSLPATPKPEYGRYVSRATGEVAVEPVMGDAWIRRLYEGLPRLSRRAFFAATSRTASRLMAYLAFDAPFVRSDAVGFARSNGIDLSAAIRPTHGFLTRRAVFLRKLDYEAVRPCPEDAGAVVSTADSKLVFGDLTPDASMPVKNRFFRLEELLRHASWSRAFAEGAYAIHRLAPPDYHWFHAPASGRVVETWAVDGWYLSVNPRAIRAWPHVLSANARAVAIIDTDIPNGTRVGRVAVIPVAAQVIGKIAWAYSDRGYDDARPVRPGIDVERGKPMGYFAPGSSTVVVLFEPGRVRFDDDLVALRDRVDLPTPYTAEVFGRRMVEVCVRVNEGIGKRV